LFEGAAEALAVAADALLATEGFDAVDVEDESLGLAAAGGVTRLAAATEVLAIEAVGVAAFDVVLAETAGVGFAVDTFATVFGDAAVGDAAAMLEAVLGEASFAAPLGFATTVGLAVGVEVVGLGPIVAVDVDDAVVEEVCEAAGFAETGLAVGVVAVVALVAVVEELAGVDAVVFGVTLAGVPASDNALEGPGAVCEFGEGAGAVLALDRVVLPPAESSDDPVIVALVDEVDEALCW
jgi:hypothetical protein